MAALGFTVDANGWPSAAHRDAAVASMQSSINRYNAYGDFGNYNVWVYYNAGIPTAQASYLGSIGFGGTYPNERVTMHEMAHYLGSGTYGDPWDGPRGEALVDQFDGLEASLNGDSAHFWPYGLNYDSEGSEINKQRQVALLYAQRADMGIGSTANPWSSTVVNMTASDPLGESGFNYANRWSDNRFAHPGAAYSTQSFLMRTPASGNSFTFVGESLTVNNNNGINGGLLYKGSGTTGITRFKQLNINGGYVRHASGAGDLFQLEGNITLTGTATIDAAQGNIRVAAPIGGTGSLTKTGGYTLTLAAGNTYAGDTVINGGILRLAPIAAIANYTFDSISGATVVNGGTGGAAMNGTLAGGASIVAGGQAGNAVSLSGGASVDINNPITDLSNTKSWTVSAWVKTSTIGGSFFQKGDGGWDNGNTIFYLGDGTGPGSGGIPSAVRWGGGFFQGSTGATNVANNAWHQITYVNNGGTYAIYVDGVAQPLSAGNGGFNNADIGSIVRLGVSTNTVAADGTVNFNGLLDNVQVYNTALNAAQVGSLFQGNTAFNVLPPTTNVTIANGGTLDLNGTTQQIGLLTGPVGSTVTLGAGRLIVGAAGNSQFTGVISGSGSIVKNGPGTLTLAGLNTYGGGTTILAGTLIVTNAAQSPILGAAATGADIQGGKLVLDYTGGSSPSTTVLAILDAGYDQSTPFSGGRLRDTVLPAGKLLGWLDDPTAKRVTVLATLPGDINLDLSVNFDDLLLLAQNYDAAAGKVWSQGDSNYDGLVNFDDLLALAQRYGLSALGSGFMTNEADPLGGQFATDWALAQSLVPEPVGLVAVLGAGMVLSRRRTGE